MVCLGNICRSPIAAAVMRERLARAGLEDRVAVTSCGTGDWHVGRPMDDRAAATLSAAGYAVDHTAQQIDPSWLSSHDVLLMMDESNLHDVVTLGDTPEGRLRKFRDFDPVGTGEDVPDPYFGGHDGFTDVLAMVERTCEELVAQLAR
ncbi:low molecular weight phosphotyrosine protein phosphatase [Nocardioides panacisoli]|nr:low molecular weight phosphotyrosine protein phosphatase [Nocardioides panacisoli]